MSKKNVSGCFFLLILLCTSLLSSWSTESKGPLLDFEKSGTDIEVFKASYDRDAYDSLSVYSILE